MQELSLNILDVAQNSVRAGATRIEISTLESTADHRLTVTIADNGCGMTEQQVQQVTDPFFTSRTTRKVGLGVPLFKMMSELTGGSFHITSQVGQGTTVQAVFCTDSIDCLPLGNMTDTIFSLVTMNCTIDFVYRDRLDERVFVFDTREIREILGEVPFNTPEIATFLREYLQENSIRIHDN